MEIVTVQTFDAPAGDVARAFRDPELLERFDLPFVGRPELVEHRVDGDRVMQAVRYRASIDLPSAARAFVDPNKLTFVERTGFAADGSAKFRFEPDHYAKLLQSSGSIALEGQGSTSVRTITSSLAVDLGWKGLLFKDQVEAIIADGFRSATLAQVDAVHAFLGRA